MASDPPPPGLAVVGGHYRLLHKLGEGAFGEVYEAQHELLEQSFAVKVLRPELCESADARSRFLDEARALIRFSHPNVVPLRHVGEHAGRLYLVMDIVAGTPLGEAIQAEGAFPEARALDVIQQVLSGLEAAHASGIIHRDLKPSNMIIERREDGSDLVRILDFGLSKLTTQGAPGNAHRSMTGTIVGTLAYMSPEQLQGERDIDKRSDVFAAGLILHEMLEGHHPYPGDSGIVVAAKLLRDAVPPLSPGIAVRDTTRVALATALQRDRDARYPSATAFAQALAGKGPPSDTSRVTTIEEARRELARHEALAADAAPVPAPSSGAVAPSAPARPAARKALKVPMALVTVLVAGAAIWWATRPDDPAPRPAVPGPVAHTPGVPGPVAGPSPRDDVPMPVGPEGPEAPEVPVAGGPGTAPGGPRPDEVAVPGDPATPDPTAAGTDTPHAPLDEPLLPEPAIPELGTETSRADAEAAMSPADCCSVAGVAFAARRWGEARDLFLQALLDESAMRETHVGALRGLAEAWLADADATARRGEVPRAVALLEEARAFLEKRLTVYGSAALNADAVRLEMGFTRMHLGEVHTELARWLQVLQKPDEAAQHLKPARDNFEFADANLRRDGPRYAEVLLRRASLNRLEGNVEAYWADLAETTRMDNQEVPAHAWVAQARGARRIAQQWGAQGNMANAHAWAQRAMVVARKGVSWCDERFARDEWLEMVRVLFAAGVWRPAEEDPRTLEGLARFWVGEAERSPAPQGEDERVSLGRLKTAQAVREFLAGISAPFAGKPEAAPALLDGARLLALEAIALRDAADKDGHELLNRYTWRVLSEIEAARGDTAAAEQARIQAQEADAHNPD